MIRLLGFLLGCAVVVALLAAWLSWEDRPDPVALAHTALERPDWRSVAPAGSPAEPTVPDPSRAHPQPRAEPGGPPSSDAAAPVVDAAPPDPGPAPATLTAVAPTIEDGPKAPDTDTAAGTPDAEAVVWRPFRSERAARGFATHLTERYGAAADVRRDGPGRYRVTLSAPDAASLAAELERLRAETGIAALEAGP